MTTYSPTVNKNPIIRFLNINTPGKQAVQPASLREVPTRSMPLYFGKCFIPDHVYPYLIF